MVGEELARFKECYVRIAEERGVPSCHSKKFSKVGGGGSKKNASILRKGFWNLLWDVVRGD